MKPVVEIAGLSGAGKSTTVMEIENRFSNGKQAWAPAIHSFFKRFYFDRIFTLVTIFRYWELFKLFKNEIYNSSKLKTHWSISLFLRGFGVFADKGGSETSKIVDVLTILNRINVIYFIAQSEAFLRNKCFIIDDGYFQRSVSVWLRLSQFDKGNIIELYDALLPNKINTYVIGISPDEAIKRAKKRDGGIRSVIKGDDENIKRSDDKLKSLYNKMADLFKRTVDSKKVYYVNIPDDSTIEIQTEMILREIHRTSVFKKCLCWVSC